jgi:2-polyprenyl-3-methyl-5-hydroxy-6-metoxy-1,4-benzoquinol methylase
MASATAPGLASSRLERVACNLCGGRDTKPFTRRQGYDVVACAGCGLVYVNPRPDERSLHAHYNSEGSSRVQYYLDAEPADRRSFGALLDRLERVVPAKGALLDVGPNVGTCLALARERGWETCGIELNAAAARHCREARGLDVRTGGLGPGAFAEASFDAVVLADVIEHLRDPLDALRLVRALLRPGGAVALSTPDIAGWAARLLQVKPEEHLYYFTPRTMAAALRQAGFEVLEITPYDRHHNLTAMTHSTTCGGLLPRLAPLFRLTRRVFGDVALRLPLRENLLAVARLPPGP